ncbi:MAG: alpha/beta hydrolase family protein [Sphingomonas sp.]
MADASRDTPLLTWPDLTNRPAPKPDATLSYGADPYQRVDVWLPTGQAPRKTVLMVHGGCWTTRIADRNLMNWIADDLRRDGYAVWNIDYRGVDRPGGGYPGTFADVAAAADLVQTDGARFGLDTHHVVAVGHSAGGHLALWLAGRRRLPHASALWRADPLPIAAVVSLGGLPDLEATAASPDNGCGTAVVAQLTGAPSAARADVFADTSVPRLLPLGVPQHLINGVDDHIIPARFGSGYLERAQQMGDTATLDRLPNTGHVELIAPESAAWAIGKQRIKAAFK